MTIPPQILRYGSILLRILTSLIIGCGIGLRLLLYFQNRNLIIDEANIVRNLAERGFAGLALPLNYEQYAPPVFLWVEKGASLLFGYGEQAMRLFPLLCGIASLFVFYQVAIRLMSRPAVLLPLALFAFGNIFLKYSAELKQYMPDTLVGLLIILAALAWDMKDMTRTRFMLLWALAGSLAIWSSMPSVFILAGVGCYYAWPLIRERQWKGLGPLAAIAAVWLIQFALYYLTILKPQINSEYLQNYHRPYFLFATPDNKAEWLHNWERIEGLLVSISGVTTVGIATNLTLMAIGTFTLLRRAPARFLLIALPVMLVLIAAALNQFSLIERVCLFMMPLWLLLVGAGFDKVWKLPAPVKGLAVLLGVATIWTYNGFWLLRRKLAFHEITEGMAWIRARGGTGNRLYVHDANVPTYLYYTELHPGRDRWKPLLGARRLKWDEDYTQLTAGISDTAYFLYTGGFPEDERKRRTAQIETNMRQVAYFEKDICYVFVYVPKSAQASGASSGTTPN